MPPEGLPWLAKDELLSFGEVNALVHPEDLHLYALAAQLAEAKASSIDHAFRMRHASGKRSNPGQFIGVKELIL